MHVQKDCSHVSKLGKLRCTWFCLQLTFYHQNLVIIISLQNATLMINRINNNVSENKKQIQL